MYDLLFGKYSNFNLSIQTEGRTFAGTMNKVASSTAFCVLHEAGMNELRMLNEYR